MLGSFPFYPLTKAAQRVNVGETVVTVNILPYADRDLSLWIENRGSTELLLELGAVDPDDEHSFSIPAHTSQPIGIAFNREIRFKRPAGSQQEQIVVTAGEGM